jgi:hypothetical protein
VADCYTQDSSFCGDMRMSVFLLCNASEGIDTLSSKDNIMQQQVKKIWVCCAYNLGETIIGSQYFGKRNVYG